MFYKVVTVVKLHIFAEYTITLFLKVKGLHPNYEENMHNFNLLYLLNGDARGQTLESIRKVRKNAIKPL